jgi:glycosyltransferase involved in cell wall biosynthesis
LSATLSVGLVADYREEGWPSMDLVADMIERHVPEVSGGRVSVTSLRPPFVRRLPVSGSSPGSVERVLNRFWDYPRWLRQRATAFDVFHVADHSYAHLVNVLPAERTVAFCHDTDAFRPFYGEGHHPSLLPRRLSRRVLEGLQKASSVLCISRATRDALAQHGLVDADRLRIVPLGVHASCSPEPDAVADAQAAALVGDDGVALLHVGSTIRRKRIDILLRAFAAARARRPALRLVRVGGPFTDDQESLARELGVRDFVRVLPHVDRLTLAAVYRRAALALLTSETEGFGLPIVEALACGTSVIATDLPVCREVGGDAVSYCKLDDIDGWASTIAARLEERARPAEWQARAARGRDRAGRFTWTACAASCVEAYEAVSSLGAATR